MHRDDARTDGGNRSESHGAGAGSDLSDVLRPYAQLVRVPNLFTAPPDVVLGAALVVGLGYAADVGAVAGLAIASAVLYAGGTTLNDYADRAVDAHERPERPIPSGDVPARRALTLGVGLLVTGVAVAGVAAGARGAAVAATVALLIVAYDGALKDSPAGFLCMGATRGANVCLGTTVAVAPTALPAFEWSVVGVVALYVATVTYVAEFEVVEPEIGEGAQLPVIVTGLAVLGATAWAMSAVAIRSSSIAAAVVPVAFAVAFLGWTGRPLVRAYREPAPETIGPVVGACVLGLVLLDAAFAGAAAGLVWAIAAGAFLVPAVVLSRAFDVQ